MSDGLRKIPDVTVRLLRHSLANRRLGSTWLYFNVRVVRFIPTTTTTKTSIFKRPYGTTDSKSAQGNDIICCPVITDIRCLEYREMFGPQIKSLHSP
jgi:hypothetical protein